MNLCHLVAALSLLSITGIVIPSETWADSLQNETGDAYPERCSKLVLQVKDYVEHRLLRALEKRSRQELAQAVPSSAFYRDALGRCASMQHYAEHSRHISDFYGNVSSRLFLLHIAVQTAESEHNDFALADADRQARALLDHMNSFDDLER